MGYRIVRSDAIIVAIGAFNPAIVTPDWLHGRGLISEADRDHCLSKMQALVENRIMAFDADWFSLRLVENQLALSTSMGVTPRLRDLALGVFSILPETPLSALGLNFVADIQFDTSNEYHQFGDTLVPKSLWNELYPDKNAGVASLVVAIDSDPRLQTPDKKRAPHQKRFTIQPSNVINVNAVHIAFNDHFDLDKRNGARDSLPLLTNQWERSQEESDRAMKFLVERTKA
jgi:hypothetical protein